MSCSVTPAENTAHSEDPSLSISVFGPPLMTPLYFSAKEWIERREHDKEADGVDSDHEIVQATPWKASNATGAPSITVSSLAPPTNPTRTQLKNLKSKQKRNKGYAEWQKDNRSRLKTCSYRHMREAAKNILASPTSFQRDYSPTKPAWIGPCDGADCKVYGLEELVDPDNQWKMKVVDWDGR